MYGALGISESGWDELSQIFPARISAFGGGGQCLADGGVVFGPVAVPGSSAFVLGAWVGNVTRSG